MFRKTERQEDNVRTRNDCKKARLAIQALKDETSTLCLLLSALMDSLKNKGNKDNGGV